MIEQLKADLNPPSRECRFLSVDWGRWQFKYHAELPYEAGFLEILGNEIQQPQGEPRINQNIPIGEITTISIRKYFPRASVPTGKIICTWRRTERGLERDPWWIP